MPRGAPQRRPLWRPTPWPLSGQEVGSVDARAALTARPRDQPWPLKFSTPCGGRGAQRKVCAPLSQGWWDLRLLHARGLFPLAAPGVSELLSAGNTPPHPKQMQLGWCAHWYRPACGAVRPNPLPAGSWQRRQPGDLSGPPPGPALTKQFWNPLRGPRGAGNFCALGPQGPVGTAPGAVGRDCSPRQSRGSFDPLLSGTLPSPPLHTFRGGRSRWRGLIVGLARARSAPGLPQRC